MKYIGRKSSVQNKQRKEGVMYTGRKEEKGTKDTDVIYTKEEKKNRKKKERDTDKGRRTYAGKKGSK